MDKTRHVTHKDNVNSPLTPMVLDAPLPLFLNSPRIPLYVGRANPKAHICLFMDAMIARGIEDAHICCLFPSTLKGVASFWFHPLSANFVGNFGTLHVYFLARFEGSIKLRKEISDLFSLRQHKLESLKGYASRFMEITADIELPNQVEAV